VVFTIATSLAVMATLVGLAMIDQLQSRKSTNAHKVCAKQYQMAKKLLSGEERTKTGVKKSAMQPQIANQWSSARERDICTLVHAVYTMPTTLLVMATLVGLAMINQVHPRSATIALKVCAKQDHIAKKLVSGEERTKTGVKKSAMKSQTANLSLSVRGKDICTRVHALFTIPTTLPVMATLAGLATTRKDRICSSTDLLTQ